MKQREQWYSGRLEREMQLIRWGHYGQPVLVYPTAGGDAEEIERMQMIDALWPMIEAGRIKVYSVDSVAGLAWTSQQHPVSYCSLLQNRFDAFIAEEIIPAIRTDCHQSDVQAIVAGASIGAFNAASTICRHPDLFKAAIAMSGTYDLEALLGFQGDENYYFAAPLHFLPNMPDGPLMDKLRRCFILLAYGKGRWENPSDSHRLAVALGAKNIPNRVDAWGEQYDHDWITWREMLPNYLEEMTEARS